MGRCLDFGFMLVCLQSKRLQGFMLHDIEGCGNRTSSISEDIVSVVEVSEGFGYKTGSQKTFIDDRTSRKA